MALEKEFKYYKDHQAELAQKYNDKFIVIKDNDILGSYDTELEAYLETKKQHSTGTFLIQRVSPRSEDYSRRFHSRVSFREIERLKNGNTG